MAAQSTEVGFREIRKVYNRAWSQTFNRQKLLLTFCVLALCGLLAVFFRGLAVNSGRWVAMSMTFLPIFVCAGVLLSLGVILTRIYHDEVKKRQVSFTDTLNRSWEVVLGAGYVSIPLILGYLLLWMLLGIFYLLKEIPGLGDFIGVVLAFGPFLLNLASLMMAVLSLAILFFVTPMLALNPTGRLAIPQIILKRLKKDLFSNLALFILALQPLFATAILLVIAAVLTGTMYLDVDHAMEVVLQWFFIMVPFTALMAPPVIFFFNLAAETHVLLRNKQKASS